MLSLLWLMGHMPLLLAAPYSLDHKTLKTRQDDGELNDILEALNEGVEIESMPPEQATVQEDAYLHFSDGSVTFPGKLEVYPIEVEPDTLKTFLESTQDAANTKVNNREPPTSKTDDNELVIYTYSTDQLQLNLQCYKSFYDIYKEKLEQGWAQLSFIAERMLAQQNAAPTNRKTWTGNRTIGSTEAPGTELEYSYFISLPVATVDIDAVPAGQTPTITGSPPQCPADGNIPSSAQGSVQGECTVDQILGGLCADPFESDPGRRRLAKRAGGPTFCQSSRLSGTPYKLNLVRAGTGTFATTLLSSLVNVAWDTVVAALPVGPNSLAEFAGISINFANVPNAAALGMPSVTFQLLAATGHRIAGKTLLNVLAHLLRTSNKLGWSGGNGGTYVGIAGQLLDATTGEVIAAFAWGPSLAVGLKALGQKALEVPAAVANCPIIEYNPAGVGGCVIRHFIPQ